MTGHPYPYAALLTVDEVKAAATYLRDGGTDFTVQAFQREVLTAIAINQLRDIDATLAALYSLATEDAS